MNLTPETVSAYRDILANPTKHNLPFPSFRDLFLPADDAIAKHIAHEKYEKIIDRNIPKVIFYILLDEIFPQKKDESGNLGWCFKFAPRFDKEFTGVLTRDGQQICVGDKVDTVQGTQFEVIKLEHISGIKYALHDGNRPYDLEPFMSPNLWLIGNDA